MTPGHENLLGTFERILKGIYGGIKADRTLRRKHCTKYWHCNVFRNIDIINCIKCKKLKRSSTKRNLALKKLLKNASGPHRIAMPGMIVNNSWNSNDDFFFTKGDF